MQSSKILVIEDDPVLLKILGATLSYGGFDIVEATGGLEALQKFQSAAPDAVLIDLGLPDVEGAELIKVLRRNSTVPIIVVSGRNTEADRIEMLDLGADDFVAKPFLPGELLARIRAVLRRQGMPQIQDKVTMPSEGQARPIPQQRSETIRPHLTVHEGRAETGGRSLKLTGAEQKLLDVLADKRGEYVSSRELIDRLWGEYDEGMQSRLRVLVNQIRRKIEEDPEDPKLIQNKRGQGYRIRA